MKAIIEYTDKQYIKKIKVKNKFKAIEELAQVFVGKDVCSDIDELVKALIEREKILSTGIGFGIAIPHAKIKSVKDITFAMGISKSGIEFDSIDGKPVHILVLVAAGERQHKEYLKLLSRIMAYLKDENMRKRIIDLNNPEEIVNLFKEQQ